LDNIEELAVYGKNIIKLVKISFKTS